MNIPLLYGQPQRWYCPNCNCTDVTQPLPPGQSQYHACPGLHGLNAPLLREGVSAKVEATEREDYLGDGVQATGDDGKVYMNVRVTREDGDDVTVFAGLAHSEMKV